MAEQRLIDANVLKMDLPTETTEDECITEAVCKIIDKQPTVDAAPVVHGKWFDGECDDGGELWYCSRCNYPVKTIAGRPAFDYCPHCGAEMDGGEANSGRRRSE